MNIYFVGSLAANEKYEENYKKIVSALKELGHKVQQDTVGVKIDKIKEETQEEREAYYKKVVKWIKTADVFVAEVSFPSSVNIGHEITLALSLNKPVLALYTKENSPMFLEGLKSPNFIITEYSKEDNTKIKYDLRKYLRQLAKNNEYRFNFFVSPAISEYLNRISKKNRMPRAVYLRKLIEKDMKAEGFEGV